MSKPSVIPGHAKGMGPEPRTDAGYRCLAPIDPLCWQAVSVLGSGLAASRRPGMTAEGVFAVSRLPDGEWPARNSLSRGDPRSRSSCSRTQKQGSSGLHADLRRRSSCLVRGACDGARSDRSREGHEEVAAGLENQIDRGEQSALERSLSFVAVNHRRHSGAPRSEEPGTQNRCARSSAERVRLYLLARGIGSGFRARRVAAPRNDDGACP